MVEDASQYEEEYEDDPDNLEITEEAYLSQLRKSLAGFLAHKITFSLFSKGRESELRRTLEHLVDSRLAEQGTELTPELRERLIDDIIQGMPTQQIPTQQDNKIGYTPETLRPVIAPYLAQNLSNDLLEPGHEKALARKIQLLTEEKLAQDKIDIPESTRQSLIRLLCEGMGISPPAPTAEPTPAAPAAPVSTEAAPAAKVENRLPEPPPTAEKSPTKQIPKLSMRAHGTDDHMYEDIPFTEEHKRKLLLDLGRHMDSSIMASGDLEKVTEHVLGVLNGLCAKQSLELGDDVKELLLNSVLSGDGVEFQL